MTSKLLPDTLLIIGANAFMDCRELESITMPAGVKTIGDSAFDDDWKLCSLKVLSIDVEFGDNVFADCDDLVIFAPTGSTAEKYAEKYISRDIMLLDRKRKATIMENIKSGLNRLDKMLNGGFRKGSLAVIAGWPGMGKTAFALQIAGNITKNGYNESSPNLCVNSEIRYNEIG